MRNILLTFVAAVAMGCVSSSHPGDPGTVSGGVQVQPGRQFDLSVGQEVQVQGTPIIIRLSGVSNESRCPSDVQCVWAGNAVVRLAISTAGTAGSEVSLNTTLDPKITAFAGYNVLLIALNPYPRSGTTIPAASYVATLEVGRIDPG